MNSMSGEKLKGIPYTGTLPAVLTGTKAGYLHKYKIYGNTEQTGTPTPENPIVPSECGERTENLFNLNKLPSDTWTTDTRYYMNGGIATSKTVNPLAVTISVNNDTLSVTTNGGNGAGFLIKVKPSTEYRLAFTKSESLASDKTSCTYALVNTSETIGYLRAINGDDDGANFTTDSNTKYVYFVFRKAAGTISYSNIMLTEGSTAPTSYIPYGYKLPLISAGQNVDIYLGESQTTRQIKKLVFDGTENWRIDDGRFTFKVTDIKSKGLRRTEFYCSSYQVISDGREYANVPNNAIYTGGGDSSGAIVYIHTDEYTDTTSFKAYLAQQYSNGTPVTIWYPLMTPITGIINEPLRKIGNYADTIDSTQTSVQIPTTANSTTISWAGSGLAPSEFDSIQEWVDTPTYKRVNGAWVADNSN